MHDEVTEDEKKAEGHSHTAPAKTCLRRALKGSRRCFFRELAETKGEKREKGKKGKSKGITAKEYSDLILSKVREVIKGDKFKDFLLSPDTLQTFRHEVLGLEDYSFCNRITLALFRASAVAGFKTWLGLGFCVKKGAKGIPIYKPLRVVAKNEGEEKEEAEAQEQDANRKPPMRFSVAYVFDVSHVEELPGEENEKRREKALDFFQRRDNRSFCRELDGDNEAMAEDVRAWINRAYPVRFERILNGSKGYTDGSAIAVKEGMAAAQTIKTILHEGAHCRLNHPTSNLSRETREIQAESAAFIAANRLGLDTGPYTFDYLAAWGNSILEAENGVVQFRNILQAAIKEGNRMAEEFKTFQEEGRGVGVISDFALCA